MASWRKELPVQLKAYVFSFKIYHVFFKTILSNFSKFAFFVLNNLIQSVSLRRSRESGRCTRWDFQLAPPSAFISRWRGTGGNQSHHRKQISNLSNQKYLKNMHNNPVSQQAQDEINWKIFFVLGHLVNICVLVLQFFCLNHPLQKIIEALFDAF